MGQWSVDTNGYYSNVIAKYITYQDKSRGRFFNEGKRTLVNGLAITQMLNRTLILPKFQDGGHGYRPLNCYIVISHFDKNFDYRESEFLNHPLVPADISKPEAVYNVSSQITATWKNIDDLQILTALGGIDSPVLHMGEALSKINITFRDKTKQLDFDKRVKTGLRRGNYLQL